LCRQATTGNIVRVSSTVRKMAVKGNTDRDRASKTIIANAMISGRPIDPFEILRLALRDLKEDKLKVNRAMISGRARSTPSIRNSDPLMTAIAHLNDLVQENLRSRNKDSRNNFARLPIVLSGVLKS